MSISARAGAWWAAWKWVIGMGLALVASISLNYYQHRQAITAPLRAEISGLRDALDDSAALQQSARESADRLQGAADAAATRLGRAGRDYAQAVRAAPLNEEQCAPGSARVGAVNRALGAHTGE